MQPLSILFLTDRFPPQIGGVSVSADRLARSLTARGHRVHVLHLNAEVEPGMLQSASEGEIVVHRLGALELPDLALQLAETILCRLHAQFGFVVFHGHYLTPAGYLAAYSARQLGARSYVSVRGNDVDRGMFDPAQLPFFLWTLQHADAIGCVSRELIAKCRVLSGREDLRYTPNSVDFAVFRPEEKDPDLLAAFAPGSEPLLGFIGELRFKKGTQFVLDAFRVVRTQRPARLLLIGGMRAEDRALLRGYLRRHPELRPHIHLVDYLRDRAQLVRHYNLLELVLAPSLWDGMPNAVLEAMACARTVVASDVGGIRDVITHGDTGFLVGVNELGRLGEGCLEILGAGEKLRRRVGRRARAYVMRHHAPAREIDRLEEAYASLIGASPA